MGLINRAPYLRTQVNHFSLQHLAFAAFGLFHRGVTIKASGACPNEYEFERSSAQRRVIRAASNIGNLPVPADTIKSQ